MIDRTPDGRHIAYGRTRAILPESFGRDADASAAIEALEGFSLLDGPVLPGEAAYGAGVTLPLPAEGPSSAATGGAETQVVDERRRFAFNAAAGGAANLVKIGVQIVLLPVMARLLGPAEFGLYALALPTISFFTTLADGGLGASLAREDEASTLVWSTAFWTLLGSCTLMAFLTVASGFVLADVSQQPRLAGIMALLSLSFPMLAVTALPAARLVRRGNLVVHSIADLVSTLLAAIVAVSLAALGAGAWALAAQYLVSWSISCAIINAAAFQRPTFQFHFASLKSHAAVGGSLIGSRLSELFGRQIENLFLGRLFGAATLGSYTFANQSSRFLCEAAGNPIWGALYSHALRENAGEVRRLHVTLSRLMASALFPASALLAASAPQVFDILMGPHWATAAKLVQVLVPFYALNAVATQCGAIMLANGRSGVLFWILTGLSAGRLLALAIGPLGGAVGIAWGIDAANAAFAAAMFVAIGATTGSSTWPLMRALLPPLVAGAVAGLVCFALLGLRPASLAWTIVSIGLGGCAFLACMMTLQGRRLMADAAAIRRVVGSRL